MPAFLFAFLSLFPPQQDTRIQVLSARDSLPLAYCSVRCSNGSFFALTDEEGYCYPEEELLQSCDSLVFSLTFYRDTCISITELPERKLFLQPGNIALKEILALPLSKEISIGNRQRQQPVSLPVGKGKQFGFAFRPPADKLSLERLSLFVDARACGKAELVLSFYEVKGSPEAGLSIIKLLGRDTLILQKRLRRGWNTFNPKESLVLLPSSDTATIACLAELYPTGKETCPAPLELGTSMKRQDTYGLATIDVHIGGFYRHEWIYNPWLNVNMLLDFRY